METIITSCSYPLDMAKEMKRLIDTGTFPSKNSIIRAGIKKIIDENKKNQNGENK